MQLINQLTRLFPLWALSLCTIALIWPQPFMAMKSAIIPMLGLVMFGMGIGLWLHDFKAVLKRPAVISYGICAQFLIMPLAACLIAIIFALPLELKIGLIILGCCPGGTASNVVCYLSKGDVALSITLTAVSTLLAVIVTPLLIWVYLGEAGEAIDVPVTKMCLDILKIVLLPVTAGVLLNHWFGHKFQTIKACFPLLSVLSIALIIAIIVALNQSKLAEVGVSLLFCIVLHNTIGLSSGYALTRLLGYDGKTARTIALEVGMQNSGLAVALAMKYFSPVAALPGTLFSIWHNLSGALLATVWASKNQADDDSS